MPWDYNKTLNLPQTSFEMRASLPTREPKMLEQWEKEDIYNKLMEKNNGNPVYVLHDGPPYANGDIHLGTALNKTLKDIIIRYKNMSGFKAPYVPGWDTHGLPTELKARKKAGVDNSTSIDPIKLREICKEFVLGYVDDQRTQFKRLGAMGEWDNPYLTLNPEFESKQIEIFGEMALKGYIYKGLKPVYWCSDCETALAEAEIEYADDPCYSIYVKFNIKDDKGKLSLLGIDPLKTSIVIWTTTTWTLPGNVAICVGPKFKYSIIKVNEEFLIMAQDLYEKVLGDAKISEYEIVGEINGSELEYMTTQHPFLDRDSLVIIGNHVTLESGTGCVHTAPGHGVDDYNVCRNYPELPIVVPVDSKGILTDEAGQFSGLSTEKANRAIADYLKVNGNLFSVNKIIHQYPHCWRCKEPILFRATEQWFCSVESFKDEAIKAVKDVKWIPSWGEDRITSMIRDRSDWCISRQRKWGVPIPILYCSDCMTPVVTRDTIDKITEIFKTEGSDSWYKRDAKDFTTEATKCPECGCKDFYKEKDIMDVWFDSGTTHASVCEMRDNLHWPADLYLEGADQYRGWFQSSLLTSVAWRGTAPYKTIVTHGWVVDGEGKKMSKSLGNGILPEEIVNQYGADILRLWVASSDYHADIRISPDILKQLSESYRKIRNTARYILGNLFDFDPNKDMVPVNELEELDKWALMKLDLLIDNVMDSYEKFEFHPIYHSLHNFCVVDMSNFYLDVLKDRLYVEKAESKKRRAAQTVIYKVLDALTRMITPILPFTAEEIWTNMIHDDSADKKAAVFNSMPSKSGVECDDEFMKYWNKIHDIRDDVKKALEIARKSKIIGSSLESKVKLYCTGELYEFINGCIDIMPTVLIVSQVELLNNGSGGFTGDIDGLTIDIIKAEGQKCERCWGYYTNVGINEEHPTLCGRCTSIVE